MIYQLPIRNYTTSPDVNSIQDICQQVFWWENTRQYLQSHHFVFSSYNTLDCYLLKILIER